MSLVKFELLKQYKLKVGPKGKPLDVVCIATGGGNTTFQVKTDPYANAGKLYCFTDAEAQQKLVA